jgi:hypothetical protein
VEALGSFLRPVAPSLALAVEWHLDTPAPPAAAR